MGEPVSVPLGGAPGEGERERVGETLGVREALLVILGVRVAVGVTVCEALGEGKQGGGAPPSSMRLMRLLALSAIHSVVPATARPLGELKRAAVPSATPAPPPPATVPTGAAGHAVTSATTRMFWFTLSAT